MTKAIEGHPRTKRFTMMLSEAEHAALVDYRFVNRIWTESEAARQLIAYALEQKAKEQCAAAAQIGGA